MHTPADFNPAHALPASVGDDALAFAFVENRLVIGGLPNAAPTIPTLGQLDVAGVRGSRHYLGELAGVPCIAIVAPAGAAEPNGLTAVGLRAVFATLSEPLLRPLRDADARSRRRAGEGMPCLRPHRLSARIAGDDGARHPRPRAAARARPALS